MAVKKDIANVVAEKHELTKKEANEILDTVVDTMQDFLGEGEGIQLTGFGSFGVRERAARKGRNPQTGEELHIPAKFVPTFKAGKYLREAVEALGNEGQEDNQDNHEQHDHHHHG